MMDVTVVGFKYQKRRPTVLKEGKITLEREFDNDYDSNAVKVLVDNILVGYVSSEHNLDLEVDNIKSIRCMNCYDASAKIRIMYLKNQLVDS